jgi:rhodanese-related sulfurtransferase
VLVNLARARGLIVPIVYLICLSTPFLVHGNADLAPTRNSGHVVSGRLVELVPVGAVLSAIERGRKVVFIDAREAPEFEEERIPGAVNLPLRAVAAAGLTAYADAELVIPYCLKDFRGFEVAKALQSRGLTNVRLLQRPGINGWKLNGLPTAGDLAQQGDGEARTALEACAQTRRCLKGQ